MKRTVIVATFLFILFGLRFLVVPSAAVEIKLRPSVERREQPGDLLKVVEKKVSLTPQTDVSDANPSAASPERKPSPISEKEREARKSATSRKLKEPVAAEDKTQKSEARVEGKGTRQRASSAPLTAAEWEKRYPRVQGATLMTVESLIPTKKLSNVRVLRMFTRIPRIEFIPKKQRDLAYDDVEVPLDGGLREPRPFDVAFSIESLDPQETDRVLVVGDGSGYSSAILSGLVAEVYAIDADRGAVKRASDACKKLRYSNVFLQTGDLLEGRPDVESFDKILVARAVESIPTSLVEQIKEGGKIIAPVGDRFRQFWILGEKKDGTVTETFLLPTRLDPLNKESSTRDLPAPEIMGGGFEELDPEPPLKDGAGTKKTNASEDEESNSGAAFPTSAPTPTGWRDAWNFEVAEVADSYEGAKVCRFANAAIALNHEKKDRNEERVRAATLPEERAEKTEASEAVKNNQRERELLSQMSQSFAVDGSTVKKLEISGAFRVARLESRKDRTTAEIVRIEFFDRDRKSLDSTTVVETALAPCAWKDFSTDVSVPARAKEATITIGLLDGIGAIEIDGLEVRDKFEKSSRSR